MSIKGIEELTDEALLADVFGEVHDEVKEIVSETPILGEDVFSAPHDKILFEDGDLGLEEMADVVHQVWCMWMEYMFSKGLVLRDKGFKINPAEHGRWRRQMITPYAQLSEDEKQSDRDIARRYLNIAWAPQIEVYDELTQEEE